MKAEKSMTVRCREVRRGFTAQEVSELVLGKWVSVWQPLTWPFVNLKLAS